MSLIAAPEDFFLKTIFFSSIFSKHMFCEKKKQTNKGFFFKAKELVIKAGSGKTWEKEELILKIRRIQSMGRFIYLYCYLLKTVRTCIHVSKKTHTGTLSIMIPVKLLAKV